jgi:DNA-binding NarL/FixJ family response regulator
LVFPPKPAIHALVSPDEESLLRQAAELRGHELHPVRTREELESHVDRHRIFVVGNGRLQVDPVSTIRRVRGRNPSSVIVGLTKEPAIRLDLLEAGATTVIQPTDPPQAIARRLQEASTGRVTLEPEETAAALRRLQYLSQLCVDQEVDISRCESLTDRERDVASLLGKHRTNSEIAAELGIAIGTVKTHVHKILSKLDVERRALAGIYWKLFEERVSRIL